MLKVSVRQLACPARGLSGSVARLGSGGAVSGRQVRGFEEIPHTGSNGYVNLFRFWKEDRFQSLHKYMEKNFKALGPIYRYRERDFCVCHGDGWLGIRSGLAFQCASSHLSNWSLACVCVCLRGNICSPAAKAELIFI